MVVAVLSIICHPPGSKKKGSEGSAKMRRSAKKKSRDVSDRRRNELRHTCGADERNGTTRKISKKN